MADAPVTVSIPSVGATLVDGIKAAAGTAIDAAKTGGASAGSLAAWASFQGELSTLVENLTPAFIDPVVPDATAMLVTALESIFVHIGMAAPPAFDALKAKVFG